MILGRYSKAPAETEVYSLQFVDDLSPGDFISASWSMLAQRGVLWDGAVKTGVYTAQASDLGRILATSYPVTLPAGQADGAWVSVSNFGQSGSVAVGGFTLAARCAAVYRSTGGVWAVEAAVQQVMVAAQSDQRLRHFVAGGVNGLNYEVWGAAVTGEGRTLIDSFICKIKEV